jgi:two-component system, NtrC family, response regulator HydG
MANILVIDDMPDVRQAVCSALKMAGHSVTEVGDGAAGLQLTAERGFDVVITDIMMPGIDGIEVIISLASRPSRPRIIAMSGGGAHVTSEDAWMLAKQKSDAWLMKPFRYNELLEVIEKLVGKGSETHV